jgi:hypothetical protein
MQNLKSVCQYEKGIQGMDVMRLNGNRGLQGYGIFVLIFFIAR